MLASFANCIHIYIKYVRTSQWAKSPKKPSEGVHFCKFGQKYTPTYILLFGDFAHWV